jgi:hypothetical protein
MKQYPLCSGEDCPIKATCDRHSETIDKDDIAFTHPPYDKRRKKCEFYLGLEESALREYIKDILDAKNHQDNL